MDEVPEDARVELSYTDRRSIEGTVGASEVRLVGGVSSRRGPLKGTWGATTVYANWRLADMAKVSTAELPALLAGRFGDDAFKLRGSFQLGPGYLLQRADISGELCGQDLRAEVYRAGGGLGSTDTVVAEGALGQAGFQLFATISDDLSKALVRGSFDGQPVLLDATRDEPSSSVRVIGGLRVALELDDLRELDVGSLDGHSDKQRRQSTTKCWGPGERANRRCASQKARTATSSACGCGGLWSAWRRAAKSPAPSLWPMARAFGPALLS